MATTKRWMTHAGVKKVPEPVMTDILVRLPVSTLMRFKLTCRSWYSIITNPSFIAKHYDHAICMNKQLDTIPLLLNNYTPGDMTYSLSVLFGGTEELLERPILRRRIMTIPHARVLGPINGIYCLTSYSLYGNVFWNPATGEVKIFPISGDVKIIRYLSNFGFGFDHRTQDYKLIGFGGSEVKMCKCYSLRKSCWRRIVTSDEISHLRFWLEPKTSINAYLNGFYYWWVYSLDHDAGFINKLYILSFDMSIEAFDLINPPVNLYRDYENIWHMKVAVLDESLAFIELESTLNLDVWVMLRLGDTTSWTLKYRIPSFFGSDVGFMGFWKNIGMLITTIEIEDTKEVTRLWLYDLSTHERKSLLPTKGGTLLRL